MATLTERFPIDVAFGFSGGPQFSTRIGRLPSGVEKRNVERQDALGRWVATQGGKDPAQTQKLVKYYRAANGMANTFPFRDWIDYEVKSGEGVFLALTGSTYQFMKRYTMGGINYDRIIRRPVGQTVAGTGGYSVNASTGVLTVNSGSAPTAWKGEFDCLCRFDSDTMDVQVIGKNVGKGLFFTWGGIGINEVPA